jgi:hypothetical protein
LLSRAGVNPHIAERVLGHAIAGVEGVCDRHSYDAEKAHALTELAALVETIVNSPSGNVVALTKATPSGPARRPAPGKGAGKREVFLSPCDRNATCASIRN